MFSLKNLFKKAPQRVTLKKGEHCYVVYPKNGAPYFTLVAKSTEEADAQAKKILGSDVNFEMVWF